MNKIISFNSKFLNFLFYGNKISLLLFHVFIGLIFSFTKFSFVVYIYMMIILFFIEKKQNRVILIPLLLALFIPFELIGRILNAFPYIPSESYKYFSIFLLLTSPFFTNIRFRKNLHIGILLFVALIPSFFMFEFSFDNFRYKFIYNCFSYISLIFGIMFFSNISLNKSHILKILSFFIFNCIPLFVVVFILSPEIESEQFSILLAQNQFSGNISSNQLSTVLSCAAFILIILNMNRLYIINLYFDFVIIFSFISWSFLTFSRGGIVSAFISFVFFYLVYVFDKKNYFTVKGLIKNLSLLFVILLTYFLVNNLTEGYLKLRLAGETQGTYLGYKDSSIDNITAGRFSIILSDIEMFKDNLLTGVGPGQSSELRKKYGFINAAPHTEITRMLAEHGAIALISIFIIFFYTLSIIYKNYKIKNGYASILVFFYFIAVLNSMHSATRTGITPFFISLIFVNYIAERKKNE